MKRLNCVYFTVLLSVFSFSSRADIPDSVLLHEVRVVERLLTQKKQAGVKRQKLDTLVLTALSHCTLSEVLSESTPIFIKTYGRGSMASASFRGTAPSHTKVLWNDMEINSPMLGMVDFSLIPSWFMDDVALCYGAASVKKSSGALGGSVELSNSPQWKQGLSFHTLSSVGSYDTYDQFFSANYSNRSFSSKSKAFYSYSGNNFKFFNKDIGNIDPETFEITKSSQRQNNADYEKYGFLQELYYKLSMKDMISFKMWGQNSRRSLPQLSSNEGVALIGSDGKTSQNNYNSQKDLSTRMVANWKHYGNGVKIRVNAGYIHTDLDYFLDVSRQANKGIVLTRTIDSKSSVDSYMGKGEIEGTLGDRTKYTASVEYTAHLVNSKEMVNKTGYRKSRQEQALGVFIQHQYNKNFSQSVMGRLPLVDAEIDPVIYSTGFQYQAGKKNQLKILASVTHNYHRPTLNDLYFQPGGNPDLKSEEGFTWEGDVEYSFEHKGFKCDLTGTFYGSDINNWIIWLPTFKGYWEPSNVKRVKVTGVEAKGNISGQLWSDTYIKVLGNYAYTRSINHGDARSKGDLSLGKQLPYIPEYSANLLVNLEWKDWFFNYQFNYYSQRYTTSSNAGKKGSNGVLPRVNRDNLYPYYMSSASLGYRFLIIKKSLAEIQFKVNNLLDEEYRSILQRPMPRRNYTLLFDLKF